MYEFSRNLRDPQKEAAIALAQAGANTAAIDLEQALGGNTDGIVGQVDIPAVPGIADTKVLTFQLQDSADGSNWAAVDPALSTTVTGAGGGGSPAKDARFRFGPGTRRYVRIAQTATASAGTFTGSFTFRLLF